MQFTRIDLTNLLIQVSHDEAREPAEVKIKRGGFYGFLVADEIVVHDIEVAAMADAKERIEFGEHLILGFGAWNVAVYFNDIEELAGERAAARELNAQIELLISFQQVVARDRRFGDVDLEIRRFEHAAPSSGIPGADK